MQNVKFNHRSASSRTKSTPGIGWSAEARQTPVPCGASENSARARILIVDDDLASCTLLSEILQPLGCAVRCAHNGADGLALCQSWKPHLVWMNLRMPILNGCEATQRIKTAPELKNTIVIALTASILKHEIEAMLTAGCDDFVCKPFEIDTILKVVKRHLGIGCG